MKIKTRHHYKHLFYTELEISGAPQKLLLRVCIYKYVLGRLDLPVLQVCCKAHETVSSLWAMGFERSECGRKGWRERFKHRDASKTLGCELIHHDYKWKCGNETPGLETKKKGESKWNPFNSHYTSTSAPSINHTQFWEGHTYSSTIVIFISI